MSDYTGNGTLESWLAEEVYKIENVPPTVVGLFEEWRDCIESDIECWMDTDNGDGRVSWRGWGRGYGNISESDLGRFDVLYNEGKTTIEALPSYAVLHGMQIPHAYVETLVSDINHSVDYYQPLLKHKIVENVSIVEMCGVVIWNAECDNAREFNETLKTYEPLDWFLRSEIRKLVKRISRVVV